MRCKGRDTGGQWDYADAVMHAVDGDETLCGIRIPPEEVASGRWEWASPDSDVDYLCRRCMSVRERTKFSRLGRR